MIDDEYTPSFSKFETLVQNGLTENEINGLFTYDRKVCKVIEERMRQIAEKVSLDLLS